MRKNMKRFMAALLAASILLGDCSAGLAAEADGEQPGQEELMAEEQTETENTDSAIQDEESPQVLFEMEELREESTGQYRLSDGTILAAQYAMDVHYRNEEGDWEEIDNRFLYEAAESAEDFDGYATAEGAVEFKFAPEVHDGELLRVTKGDYSVGFRMLTTETEVPEAGVSAAAELSETAGRSEEISDAEVPVTELQTIPISFLRGEILNPQEAPTEGADGGAFERNTASAGISAFTGLQSMETGSTVEKDTMQEDAAQEPEVLWADVTEPVPETENASLLDSMKMEQAVSSVGYGNILPGISLQYVLAGSSLKEYILVNQRKESYSYDFKVNLANLIPEMQEDGSILLKDEESGAAVYEIPAACMTDSAGAYSEEVEMQIWEDETEGWILRVTADKEWINAKERVLPVQIDPTLNYLLDSLTDIRGSYVAQGYPTTSNVQYGNLMVGYDSSGSRQLRSYIQLRNLPTLPKDSVICGAVCHFGIVNFSHVGHSPMHIRVREITDDTSWTDCFTWNTRPNVSTTILDYRSISSSSVGSYVGWNITELIKRHYEAGNQSGSISGFALEAYGGTSMGNTNCAKATLRLTRTTAYPVLQIMYRDTKGIEDYYTYRIQDIGNAGVGYVGDYNSQLTLVKPVASYGSTIMPYSLSLVYNSSHGDKYFTNDGKNIHSKNFTNMKLGMGWKLSAQETVTAVTVQNLNTTDTWLVYNDSDGTEHYFKQFSSGSSVYEDEDGLNLTITKSGSDFTMKDKQDNRKFFKNGYLTKITDANENEVHIVYNGKGISDNTVDGSTNRITSVHVKPRGGTAEEIFTLSYDQNNCLTGITEKYGNSYQIGYITGNSGKYQLKRISCYDSTKQEYVEIVRYGYNGNPNGVPENLGFAFDVEADAGMHYGYEKRATGYRVCYFHEYAVDAGDNHLLENRLESKSTELRKTVYRDYGADGASNTSDDILTTCLFNSCGQTINMSTRDQQGNILGVTASAYEKNSGTSKKNNRMSDSILAGQAGINLLTNGGFEKYTESGENSTAVGWVHVISGGNAACRTSSPYSGNAHYNLFNENTEKTQ
ncbi:MAG: DNRLRE domain-containing protein, partial [Lachnospiraceae bacterium]